MTDSHAPPLDVLRMSVTRSRKFGCRPYNNVFQVTYEEAQVGIYLANHILEVLPMFLHESIKDFVIARPPTRVDRVV